MKKWGIARSASIVDKNRVLQEALYAVGPDGHTRAVLDRVQQF